MSRVDFKNPQLAQLSVSCVNVYFFSCETELFVYFSDFSKDNSVKRLCQLPGFKSFLFVKWKNILLA